MYRKNPELLSHITLLFDSDTGLQIFPSYSMHDPSWLLERTTSKTKGMLIRLSDSNGKNGLWIGEYSGAEIIREERIYEGKAIVIRKIIEDFKNSEKIKKKLSIGKLKKILKSSEIVQNFRYFYCVDLTGDSKCENLKKIKEEIVKRLGSYKGMISYPLIAGIINKHNNPCSYSIVCPLKSPNEFDRVHNLDILLKKHNRDYSGMKFTDGSNVYINLIS